MKSETEARSTSWVIGIGVFIMALVLAHCVTHFCAWSTLGCLSSAGFPPPPLEALVGVYISRINQHPTP